ncbi:MAG: MarR family transcriptional regulator [Clostridiales bacterium]|uniref:MarR family winged helix-turn-helix transcriptional regulator n=1 Tax=Clostridia TaxID=186801 RepID=UPI0018AB769E|nr:MarR family transcriptional regulator [Clostridium sp. 1001270J_160509_D11]MDU1201492.1 MarR family transcriptional regulator [Clostridiales bacterium]
MKNNSSKRMLEFNEVMKENNDLYSNLAKKFKMSDCMLWILYILREENKVLTQSDICNMMCIPKQTVNSSLKKMEAEGYIELLNINDKRSKQVSLTEKGLDLANNTVDIIISKENNALSKMDEKEQELLINLLRKFNDLLKDSFLEI